MTKFLEDQYRSLCDEQIKPLFAVYVFRRRKHASKQTHAINVG